MTKQLGVTNQHGINEKITVTHKNLQILSTYLTWWGKLQTIANVVLGYQ